MILKDLISYQNNALPWDVLLEEVIMKMAQKHIQSIVLIDNNRPVGIITERDILFLYSRPEGINLQAKAFDTATKPVITTFQERPIAYVLSLMIDHNICRIIVVDHKQEYIGTILQEEIIYTLEKSIYTSQLKLYEIIQPSNKAIFVNHTSTLQETLKVMSKNNIGSVLVYKEKQAVGIITESDIVQLANHLANRTHSIEEFMHSPVIEMNLNTLVHDAIASMKENNIRRIVVKDRFQSYFVITSADILENVKGNYNAILESKLINARDTFNQLNQAIIELYDLGDDQVIHWFNDKAKSLLQLTIGDSIKHYLNEEKWQELYHAYKSTSQLSSRIFHVGSKLCEVKLLSTPVLGTTIIKLIFNELSYEQDTLATSTISHQDIDESSLIQTLSNTYILYRLDTQGLFTYVSPTVTSILGYTQEEFLTHYSQFTTHNLINKSLPLTLQHIIQGQELTASEIEVLAKNGSLRRLSVTHTALFSDGKIIGVQGIAKDITHEWQNRIVLKGKMRVLSLLASRASQREVLDAILEYVETQDPQIIASIQLYNPSTHTLCNGASRKLPEFYLRAIDNLLIGEGVGSCGTAAFRKGMVVIDDITTHPYWREFHSLIEHTNLQACWSQPILSASGDLLGTFGLYYTKIKSPSQEDITMIKSAANLTAIALEYLHANRVLIEMEERERMLLESSTNGILV